MAVLKTVGCKRSVGSNPTSPAKNKRIVGRVGQLHLTANEESFGAHRFESYTIRHLVLRTSPHRLVWYGTWFGTKHNVGSNPTVETNSLD